MERFIPSTWEFTAASALIFTALIITFMHLSRRSGPFLRDKSPLEKLCVRLEGRHAPSSQSNFKINCMKTFLELGFVQAARKNSACLCFKISKLVLKKWI